MEKSNKYQNTERRKYKRLNVYHLLQPIQIKTSKENISIAGILLDISAGGIGILSFKEIPLETITELTINLHNIKTDIIKARVVWVKSQEKIYRIGLQFIEISKKDFIQISNFVNSHLEEDMQ
ncbi:MAG: PilZ domain-containing protein [Elusimicrobiota bacterium]|nr:PilZ domain-containing protein [Endomicrobiia bacterium]MDW8165832.1 PilZ domain-containing protein [Elusimicrobiota bacterium]